MDTAVGVNWWGLVLRGIVAILFGIAAFIWPGITLVVLVYLFGAFVLVNGLIAIYVALTSTRTSNRWGLLLIEGVVGVLFGLATFFYPGITALILLYIIAFWAIVTGIVEIVAAIAQRERITNEWLLAIAGVLTLLFGILLLFYPGAGALTVLFLIAAYAVVYGIVLVVLGFQVRGRQAPTA